MLLPSVLQLGMSNYSGVYLGTWAFQHWLWLKKYKLSDTSLVSSGSDFELFGVSKEEPGTLLVFTTSCNLVEVSDV